MDYQDDPQHRSCPLLTNAFLSENIFYKEKLEFYKKENHFTLTFRYGNV
jgi:hypothetical protein